MELKIILEALSKKNNKIIEKVNLGLVDELRQEVETIQRKVQTQKTLYKNTEKEYNIYIKLLKEAVDAEAKTQKQLKSSSSLFKFAFKESREIKALIKNAQKKATKAENSLKELGLDSNIPEINQLRGLNQDMKQMDFGFRDELPF
jgi:DNA mismatch repair ATPase MutS